MAGGGLFARVCAPARTGPVHAAARMPGPGPGGARDVGYLGQEPERGGGLMRNDAVVMDSSLSQRMGYLSAASSGS